MLRKLFAETTSGIIFQIRGVILDAFLMKNNSGAGGLRTKTYRLFEVWLVSKSKKNR